MDAPHITIKQKDHILSKWIMKVNGWCDTDNMHARLWKLDFLFHL